MAAARPTPQIGTPVRAAPSQASGSRSVIATISMVAEATASHIATCAESRCASHAPARVAAQTRATAAQVAGPRGAGPSGGGVADRTAASVMDMLEFPFAGGGGRPVVGGRFRTARCRTARGGRAVGRAARGVRAEGLVGTRALGTGARGATDAGRAGGRRPSPLGGLLGQRHDPFEGGTAFRLVLRVRRETFVGVLPRAVGELAAGGGEPAAEPGVLLVQDGQRGLDTSEEGVHLAEVVTLTEAGRGEHRGPDLVRRHRLVAVPDARLEAAKPAARRG